VNQAPYYKTPTSYIPAVFIVALYWASLDYGYVWDDYFELRRSLSDMLSQISHHFRPFIYLSFYFTRDILDTPAGQRAINIAMMALSAWIVGSILNQAKVRHPWAYALVVFAHPSFVYSATWLTMRVDCFVILFLLLTFRNFENRWGMFFLLLSDFSKAPFLLQNLWFSVIKFRQGHRLTAAFVLIVMIALFGSIIVFWLGVNSQSTSPTSKLALEPVWQIATIALIRSAKIVEGVFLIHFPIFAYYSPATFGYLTAALIALLICWSVIIFGLIKTRSEIPMLAKHSLVLAVLSSLPFAIVTDPRVLGPAIPFWLMFWTMMSAKRKSSMIALFIIGAIGFGGTIRNYKVSDTGVYELNSSIDYKLCGPHELTIPGEQWRCDRSKFATAIILRINEFQN